LAGRALACSLGTSSNSRVRRVIWTVLLAACAAPAASTPSPTIPTSSPAPTTTVTATPAATPTNAPSSSVSPSSAAADPARYGYVMASQGRIVVRGERATASALALGGNAPAASHDGKRIAFWRTGPQGSNPQELRIVDVISGTERVVTTAPSAWNGGAIAWSNHDSGLLYEIHRVADPNAPPGPPVAPPSRMFSIDLAAPSAQPLTHASLDFDRGLVFIPLAWDEAAGIAAALTTGEGGYAAEWVVWDKKANTVKKTRFPWQVIYGDVSVSTDASMALANDWGANALHFWPLADIGNDQRLTPRPDATVKSRGASWRPGARGEFAWVTGSSVSLYTFATDRVPTPLASGQDIAIVGWRADGSGILVTQFGGGIFVVDLATLQVTPLPNLAPVGAAESLGPPVGGVLLR